MTAVIDPAKYMAAEVVYYAYVDLIHQKTQFAIDLEDFDGAAEFFLSGDYIPWCYIAGIDPDKAFEYALKLAYRYFVWTQHPTVFPRPYIKIPNETWRRNDA